MSVHAAISLLLWYKPTVKLYQEKKSTDSGVHIIPFEVYIYSKVAE